MQGRLRMTEPNTITLYRADGEESGSIEDFLKNFKPQLVWIEPRPTPELFGVECKFSGLQKVKQDTWREVFNDIQVDEVRLFWDLAMLHIVSNENGFRWFACGESDLENLGFNASKPDDETKQRIEKKVYLRTDWDRFGLIKDDSLPDTLQVVEYWEGVSLVAWRLEIEK